MNTSESMKDTLELQPIGTDFWSRPVYKDQHGHLWKDVTLGSNQPDLCSVVDNAFDGEPDMPIRRPFIILSKEGQVDENKRFQYQMLDRYRCDCDYYLGYGNRNSVVLPLKDERKLIEEMKRIWLSFSEEEKPKWLTWDQILEYEKAMCSPN